MAIMKGILTSLLPPVVKAIAEAALAKSRSAKPPTSKERVRAALQQHLRQVAKWTGEVHSLDQPAPFATDTDTVEIGFDSQPRRFAARGRSVEIGEAELLLGDTHYLVLGNPGSGKSTAVKRIARRVLLQEAQPSEAIDFPVVLRLRELQRGEPLFGALARALGIDYEVVEISGAVGEATVKRIEVRIGTVPISTALPEILSSFRPLVLLDGLDEVWSDTRSEVAEEIALLAENLATGKLIVTSRPSEFVPMLAGLTVIELRPLSEVQIRTIAERRLGDASGFLSALQQLPYRDIADRPLLLTQLTILFDRYGVLPSQPASVYRKVLRILLEEWDAERRVRRPSRYAGFDTDRKADFLADIAFYLTYSVRQAQFSESDLIAAYEKVYARFSLPANDAKRVVREIETHTGIILSAGADLFEFSHLSIQEYLCASFLVRSGAPLLVRQALDRHSPSVAVAAAMSSQPSEWLARLILDPEHQAWVDRAGIQSFFYRLMLERPGLEPYEPLGAAVAHLVGRQVKREARVPVVLERFMQDSMVELSIALALRLFDITSSSGENSVVWLRRRDVRTSYATPIPGEGAVPREVLSRIAMHHPKTKVWQRRGRESQETLLQDFLLQNPPS